MHNKRLIITSEPSSQGKFKTEFIKNFTGGTEIIGRDLHCSKSRVIINASFFVDSNNKLPFQGEIDDAIVERLIEYEFVNSYTNDTANIGKPTANGGVYIQINTFYKTNFLENYIEDL